MILVLACLLYGGCKNIKDESSEQVDINDSYDLMDKEEALDNKEAEETSFLEQEEKSPEASIAKIAINDDLCTTEEVLVYGFQIADSDKKLAVCMDEDESYLVYRYGTKDKLELEYPENKENAWDNFTYSYYLRGGGADNAGLDLNYLVFENKGYQYQVYDEYSAETGVTEVGVRVRNLETGAETDIKGDYESEKGSLITFRDSDKIKIVE